MTVSLGNGVDIGNIVTSEINPLTGVIEYLDVPLVATTNFTWATKPEANAVPGGTQIRVTDVPAGGRSLWVSDGTYWRYADQVSLAQSGSVGTTTSGTTETVLAAVTVPAGALADNGLFIVEALVSYTPSANNKTFNLRVGGTGVNGTVLWTQNYTTTTKAVFRCGFQNRNTAAAQVQAYCEYSGGYSGTSGALLTATVDTAVEFTVFLTAVCANGADQITLQRFKAALE